MRGLACSIDDRLVLSLFIDIVAFIGLLYFGGSYFDQWLRSMEWAKYGLIFLVLLGAAFEVLPLVLTGSTLGLALVGLKLVTRKRHNVGILRAFGLYLLFILSLSAAGQQLPLFDRNLRLIRRKSRRKRTPERHH